MTTKSDRFEWLVPHSVDDARVLIIGCGAIGSYLGVILAKMGVRRFTLFDHDKVELANVGVQNFDNLSLEKSKATELAAKITLIEPDAKIEVFKGKFKGKDKRELKALSKADIIIPSVDNLPTRRKVWKLVKHMHNNKRFRHSRLYIDPRMGAESFEIWATELGRGKTIMSKKDYEISLKGNIPDAPCGMKATPYTAPPLAGKIAVVINDWLKGDPFPTFTVESLRHRTSIHNMVVKPDEIIDSDL